MLAFRCAGLTLTRPPHTARYGRKGGSGKQGSAGSGGGLRPKVPLPATRRRATFLTVLTFREVAAQLSRPRPLFALRTRATPLHTHRLPPRKRAKPLVPWIRPRRRKKRERHIPEPRRPLTDKERLEIEIALAWERGDYAMLIAWGVIDPLMP